MSPGPRRRVTSRLCCRKSPASYFSLSLFNALQTIRFIITCYGMCSDGVLFEVAMKKPFKNRADYVGGAVCMTHFYIHQGKEAMGFKKHFIT